MLEEAKSLLSWYAENGRLLPWRKDKDPYHVALSEIMLQQTRIISVIPKYEAFLSAFPSWEDLASADEDEVLKLWEGLGYYSRAKNLHKAAMTIARDYGGNMPRKAEEIAKLPGFGEYTSAAVASICFNEKTVSCDGNLCRVYARIKKVRLAANEPVLKKKAITYFQTYMDEADAGSINQALMEVGETVCLPHGEPLCTKCPLSAFCLAYRKGRPTDYPLPKTKSPRVVEPLTVLVYEYEGKYALEKRGKGLLSSLYGFPTLPGKRTLIEMKEAFPNHSVKALGSKRFFFTHREWDMAAYRIKIKEPLDNLRFYSLKQIKEELSLPTAFRFVLAALTLTR